jgi:CRISPR-associated endonuclease Csy4
MDHHIDITLLPDVDFMPNMLLGALYNKLHRGLVTLQTNRVAVSFPKYQGKGKKQHLGDVLRLHGSKTNLQALIDTNWLRGMSDHIDKTEILPVPAATQHLQVKRVQCKSNVERLRARYMKRKNTSREEAVKALPDSVERTLALPFVNVKSVSTGQQFRLFIKQSAVEQENPDATFNCYGLSSQGTVPSF